MKAVVITGVSRGLGEALAAASLKKGYSVLGIGRSNSAALGGDRYRFVECDLAYPARIAATVGPALDQLAKSMPAAVTLINNAAVPWPVGVVGRLDIAEAEAAVATNLTAPLALASAFLRAFPDDAIERRIINISSGAAQSPLPGSAVYSMSKAAIEMLTRTLAAEYTGSSLRCITLRPGIFETAMQAYMRGLDPAVYPNVALFRGFKENGLLKPPSIVASAIVARLVEGSIEHGRTYTQHDL